MLLQLFGSLHALHASPVSDPAPLEIKAEKTYDHLLFEKAVTSGAGWPLCAVSAMDMLQCTTESMKTYSCYCAEQAVEFKHLIECDEYTKVVFIGFALKTLEKCEEAGADGSATFFVPYELPDYNPKFESHVEITVFYTETTVARGTSDGLPESYTNKEDEYPNRRLLSGESRANRISKLLSELGNSGSAIGSLKEGMGMDLDEYSFGRNERGAQQTYEEDPSEEDPSEEDPRVTVIVDLLTDAFSNEPQYVVPGPDAIRLVYPLLEDSDLKLIGGVEALKNCKDKKQCEPSAEALETKLKELEGFKGVDLHTTVMSLPDHAEVQDYLEEGQLSWDLAALIDVDEHGEHVWNRMDFCTLVQTVKKLDPDYLANVAQPAEKQELLDLAIDVETMRDYFKKTFEMDEKSCAHIAEMSHCATYEPWKTHLMKDGNLHEDAISKLCFDGDDWTYNMLKIGVARGASYAECNPKIHFCAGVYTDKKSGKVTTTYGTMDDQAHAVARALEANDKWHPDCSSSTADKPCMADRPVAKKVQETTIEDRRRLGLPTFDWELPEGHEDRRRSEEHREGLREFRANIDEFNERLESYGEIFDETHPRGQRHRRLLMDWDPAGDEEWAVEDNYGELTDSERQMREHFGLKEGEDFDEHQRRLAKSVYRVGNETHLFMADGRVDRRRILASNLIAWPQYVTNAINAISSFSSVMALGTKLIELCHNIVDGALTLMKLLVKVWPTFVNKIIKAVRSLIEQIKPKLLRAANSADAFLKKIIKGARKLAKSYKHVLVTLPAVLVLAAGLPTATFAAGNVNLGWLETKIAQFKNGISSPLGIMNNFKTSFDPLYGTLSAFKPMLEAIDGFINFQLRIPVGSTVPGCPAGADTISWQAAGRTVTECVVCSDGYSGTDTIVGTPSCCKWLWGPIPECKSPLTYEVEIGDVEYIYFGWLDAAALMETSPMKEIIAIFSWVEEVVTMPVQIIIDAALEPVKAEIRKLLDSVFGFIFDATLPNFPTIDMSLFFNMLDASVNKFTDKIPTTNILNGFKRQFNGMQIGQYFQNEISDLKNLLGQGCPWIMDPMSSTFVNNLQKYMNGNGNALNDCFPDNFQNEIENVKGNLLGAFEASGLKSIMEGVDFAGIGSLLGSPTARRREEQLREARGDSLLGDSICLEWDDPSVAQPAFCTGPVEGQKIMPCIGLTWGFSLQAMGYIKTVGISVAFEFCFGGGWNEGFSVDIHFDFLLGGLTTMHQQIFEKTELTNPAILLWMNRGQWLGHGHAVGINTSRKWGVNKGDRSLTLLFARPWTWFPGDAANSVDIFGSVDQGGLNRWFLIPEGIMIEMESLRELSPRQNKRKVVDRLARFSKDLWKTGLSKPHIKIPFFIAAVVASVLSTVAANGGRRLEYDPSNYVGVGDEDWDEADTPRRRAFNPRTSRTAPMKPLGDLMGGADEDWLWNCGGDCDLLKPKSGGKAGEYDTPQKRMRLPATTSKKAGEGLTWQDIQAMDGTGTTSKVKNGRSSENDWIRFTGKTTTISEDLQEYCEDTQDQLTDLIATDLKLGTYDGSILQDMIDRNCGGLEVGFTFENGFVIGVGFGSKGIRIEPPALGCMISNHRDDTYARAHKGRLMTEHCGPWCVCPNGTPWGRDASSLSGFTGCKGYPEQRCDEAAGCTAGTSMGIATDSTKQCTSCTCSNGMPKAGEDCPGDMDGCLKVDGFYYPDYTWLARDFFNSNPESCKTKCSEVTECEGWRLDTQTNKCSLMKDMPMGQTAIANSRYTSGKKCPPFNNGPRMASHVEHTVAVSGGTHHAAPTAKPTYPKRPTYSAPSRPSYYRFRSRYSYGYRRSSRRGRYYRRTEKELDFEDKIYVGEMRREEEDLELDLKEEFFDDDDLDAIRRRNSNCVKSGRTSCTKATGSFGQERSVAYVKFSTSQYSNMNTGDVQIYIGSTLCKAGVSGGGSSQVRYCGSTTKGTSIRFETNGNKPMGLSNVKIGVPSDPSECWNFAMNGEHFYSDKKPTGTQVATVSKSTPSLCKRACLENANCKFFWHKGSSCKLMKQYEGFVVESGGTSGFKCVDGGIWNANGPRQEVIHTCKSGYQKNTNLNRCVRCTCRGGFPATGDDCPQDGQEKCTSCVGGWMFKSYSNTCTHCNVNSMRGSISRSGIIDEAIESQCCHGNGGGGFGVRAGAVCRRRLLGFDAVELGLTPQEADSRLESELARFNAELELSGLSVEEFSKRRLEAQIASEDNFSQN